MESFYVSLDKKNTERVKNFLSGITNDNEEQTNHWSKRTISNIPGILPSNCNANHVRAKVPM